MGKIVRIDPIKVSPPPLNRESEKLKIKKKNGILFYKIKVKLSKIYRI